METSINSVSYISFNIIPSLLLLLLLQKAKVVGSWLVNVSVSELMNIHRAGRRSRSGGKFKRSCLRLVACSRWALSRSVTIVQQPPSSARPGSSVAMACLITMNNLHMALV